MSTIGKVVGGLVAVAVFVAVVFFVGRDTAPDESPSPGGAFLSPGEGPPREYVYLDDVRVSAIGRGPVVLETHVGDVEVGIPEGNAAWLEASSAAGRVHNALEAADAPGPSAQTVEVRARTSVGDVVIRRP